MFANNHLWMGIILASISQAIMSAPTNAFPDEVFINSNFVADDFVADDLVIPFDSFAGFSGAGGLDNSVSIPANINTSNADSTSSGNSSIANTNTTITRIAEYFASNIERSLEDLNTSELAQEPVRIVRRRRTFCPNPAISRSSEELDHLLIQSEQFIDDLESIKPENRLW